MSTNEVFKLAQNISLPVGAGAQSGDPVRVGSINAIVVADDGTQSGVTTSNEANWASCWNHGAHKFNVVTSAARAHGTKVYAIPNATTSVKKVTLTDTDNSGANAWYGVLLEAITGAGTTRVAVIINPQT